MRIHLHVTTAIVFAFMAPAFARAGFASIEKREGREIEALIPKGDFLGAEAVPVDLMKYDHLDPRRQVPTRALERAVKYFDANKAKIKNQRYVTIIDVKQHSSKKRMFVVDMKSGAVRAMTVAHGKGSDSDGDGYATKFSNVEGSLATSIGFYLTGSKYKGSHGTSMYLHGLEKTNSNAYKRAIVMHGASYVTSGRAGRSWGCPAVAQNQIATLVPQLMNGSLLYIHFNQ